MYKNQENRYATVGKFAQANTELNAEGQTLEKREILLCVTEISRHCS